MFRKILVPTDGSRYAIRAAEVAADVARRYHAEVTVLLASDLQSVRSSPAPDDVKAALERTLHETDAESLANTAAIFTVAGIEAKTKVVEGAPAHVIAREAEDGNYELVVMGSRGLGLPDEERWFLGSVTERVLRLVSCPVLTVKV
jgi:nucleotide-binding universal stress UspA family protein